MKSSTIKGLVSRTKWLFKRPALRQRQQIFSLVLLLSVVLLVVFFILDSSSLTLDVRHRLAALITPNTVYAQRTGGSTAPSPKETKRKARHNRAVRRWVKQFQVDMNYQLPPGLSPWDLADSWVTPEELLPPNHPQLGAVLNAMSTLPVVSADVPRGLGGASLKLVLRLAGGQKVLFKPQWYPANEKFHQRWPCPSMDRHSAEIAAFHLSRLLGFRKTPLTVGRILKLSRDIIPVASQGLADYIIRYGKRRRHAPKCKWCVRFKRITPNSTSDHLAGSVSLWLPERIRLPEAKEHPWRTRCSDGSNDWKNVSDYCTTVLQSSPYKEQPQLMLDIIDGAILSYLLNNPDQKLYVGRGDYRDLILSVDSGKGLAGYQEFQDHPIILAPVYQCCMVKSTTYHRLLSLANGTLGAVMSELLMNDPASPLLDKHQYIAFDRRLSHVIQEITRCIDKHGHDGVLVF